MLWLFTLLEYILVLIYFTFETDFLHTFSSRTARDSCIINTFETSSLTCTYFLAKEMWYQGEKKGVEEAKKSSSTLKQEMYE